MSSFVVLTIQYLILLRFGLFDKVQGYYIELLSKLIVGILYLVALPVVWKRKKFFCIVVYLISVLILIIHSVIFKGNFSYIKTILFPLLFTCISSFIYAISLDNLLVLKTEMEKTARIILFIGIILIFSIFIGSINISKYSMALSYYMLIPAIMYLNKLFRKYTIKNFIGFFISFLIIIAFGARGPILCILFFAVTYLKIIFKNINYKKIFIIILFIFIILTLVLFFYDIINILYNLLSNFGIRSRTLWLLLHKDYNLSGREEIADIIIEAIAKNPILGIGIAGDRVLLEGSYSHNIVIEVISNFGIILGILLLSVLGIKWIKSLFSKNESYLDIILIWSSIGFIHLFISSSYLIDFKFWIFIGVLFNNTKNCNNS